MGNDVTEGSVFHHVVRFALPYLFSYFLQMLYGLADLFIIGQFGTVADTTAVSVGSQLMHLVTLLIVGLAMGSTVNIGHGVGEGDPQKVSDSIGNTISLFVLISVIAAVFFFTMAERIVSLMQTPPEAAPGCVIYLRICFAGIPCIAAYNVISAIFRGLGDSKSPMYFIAAACAANIALDYLFIGGLGMGAAGAALGTVLGQLVSVVFALNFIRKQGSFPHLKAASLKIKREVSGAILRGGFPIAMQDTLIQVAFLAITLIANMRGLTDAAAVGIVEKIITFLFLVPSAMLATVSSLGSQNIGAGKMERAVSTLRYALLIAVSFGVAVSVLMQFAALPVVSLFTDDAAVAYMGAGYIRGYIFDTIFAGIHFCFSGFFCACKRPWFSFAQNIIAISLIRIPGVYFMSALFPDTLFPMGLVTATSSACSALICVILFTWLKRIRRMEDKL